MTTIALKTTDGLDIAALYAPGSASKGVLLLHMMPATKESWEPIMGGLHAAGHHVLALDLRGHGASSGGPDGYRSFSDAGHQASIADVAAGFAYLASKGVPERKIAIVGASIGANLALKYAAEHPILRTVLLSPGLNYRGVETLPYAARMTAETRILIVSSEDDDENVAMSKRLAAELPPNVARTLLQYHAAGHGTDMFGKESPDLAETILAWLE